MNDTTSILRAKDDCAATKAYMRRLIRRLEDLQSTPPGQPIDARRRMQVHAIQAQADALAGRAAAILEHVASLLDDLEDETTLARLDTRRTTEVPGQVM